MSIQYQYDEQNRLVAVVYEGGQEISYAYDAAGNQISVIVKDVPSPDPAPKAPKQSSQRKRSSTRSPK